VPRGLGLQRPPTGTITSNTPPPAPSGPTRRAGRVSQPKQCSNLEGSSILGHNAKPTDGATTAEPRIPSVAGRFDLQHHPRLVGVASFCASSVQSTCCSTHVADAPLVCAPIEDVSTAAH
jgi:hypothetical protein